MRLEIKDLESSTVYDIGESGAVLGRERAKTDIALRDESISKRHARIFYEGGRWLLEDLGSSNGTWIDEQRLSVPTPLRKGAFFSLAQRRFEVLVLEAAHGATDDFPPEPSLGLAGVNDAFEPRSQVRVSAAEDDADQPRGPKALLLALGQGLAHHLARAPMMAVNPIGSIRRAAADQPILALGKLQLAGFAFPAGVFSALVGALAAVAASALAGALSFAGLVLALPVAAVAGVVFAIVGFVMHPVARWVIEKLQGQSSPRSRTNYAVEAFTFAMVAAVPNAVGTVVGALPLPFIGLVGPLLSTLVALVGLYLAYTWARVFELVAWARYAVLGLGLLLVGVSSVGLVVGAIDSVDLLLSGQPLVTQRADVPETGGSVALVTGAADAAGASARGEPPRAEVEGTAAATASPSREVAVARPAPAEVPPPAEAARPAEQEAPAEPPVEKGAADPATPVKAPPPPPEPRGAAQAPRRPAGQDLEQAPLPTEDHPLGATPFVEYLRKRDAVEKAISDQPALLRRRDVLEDYEQLWAKTYEIRERWAKKQEKERWRREKILVRFKDAEVLEATEAQVNRLYARIFGE
jgi:hypothetical protein